jgi:SAM-dependent methyltransferase
MKSKLMNRLADMAHRGGRALRAQTRPALPGRFQAYNHTLPNRYPWLFEFAAAQMRESESEGAGARVPRLLSFGCSVGDEVFALRNYFPQADIKGIDIDPRNVATAAKRARTTRASGVEFSVGATTREEASESFDAIFCLAVLCLGDLTVQRAERCDPALTFANFDRLVTDFHRCLTPGGWLWLHTTNFRFSDTTVASEFDVVLQARPEQMAPDVQYGRDNQLLYGERHRAVGFRKRETGG